MIAFALTLSIPAVAAAQAPVAKPDKLTSFKRSNGEWDVTTTVWLRADGVDLKGLRFAITRLPALGDLSCDENGAPAKIEQQLVPVNEASAFKCVYKPKVGLTGPDYIYYYAVTSNDGNTQKSQPARIDIDVQSRGLRWEFIPTGSSGLSSDNVNEGSLPEILGKNAQDFIFVLNWVTNFPEARIVREPGAPRNATPFVTAKNFTPSMGLTIRTGLATSPMTVEAVDRGSASGTSTESSTNTEARTGFRRAFTFNGQWDGNFVFKSDGAGSYLEIGSTAKAGYNVATETETIEVESNRLIQLFTKEKGTFHWETGFRFALKQDEDEFGTTIFERTGPKATDQPESQQKKNAKELFIFEWLYLRDNAFAGLPAPGGKDPTRRISWRAIGIPNLKGLPLQNRMRPYIGIEISCVRDGIGCAKGDQEIKRVLYGVNFSAR